MAACFSAYVFAGDANTIVGDGAPGLIRSPSSEFSREDMEKHEPVTIVITAPDQHALPVNTAWTVKPNVVSALFLSWMTSLMWMGFKRQLSSEVRAKDYD